MSNGEVRWEKNKAGKGIEIRDGGLEFCRAKSGKDLLAKWHLSRNLKWTREDGHVANW